MEEAQPELWTDCAVYILNSLIRVSSPYVDQYIIKQPFLLSKEEEKKGKETMKHSRRV